MSSQQSASAEQNKAKVGRRCVDLDVRLIMYSCFTMGRMHRWLIIYEDDPQRAGCTEYLRGLTVYCGSRILVAQQLM